MSLRSVLKRLQDEPTMRLRALYENPDARLVLDAFGAMPVGTRSATVTDLERRTGMTRKRIINACRKIVTSRWGSFKCGRRGSDSRIVEPQGVRRIYEIATTKAKVAPTPAAPRLVTHSFHLRPHLDVKLDLPEDLTEDEAGRLGGLLMALPS